jgi:RHS repeat-associated protein
MSFLYDSANIVQELSGSTPTANLLTGLGVDERFTRTDSSGTANFLTDALGSTLALTSSSGSTLAQYAYEPFGNTTVTSGSSTNPYEYTGRENDGTGLYYYRARYYSPTTMRFLSEDPSGFGAGPNFYAYTGDNPIDFDDPLGLNQQGGCFDTVSVNCSKQTPLGREFESLRARRIYTCRKVESRVTETKRHEAAHFVPSVPFVLSTTTRPAFITQRTFSRLETAVMSASGSPWTATMSA